MSDSNPLEELSLQVFDAGAGIPKKAQAVIALRAFNFSAVEIGKIMGYKDDQGVYQVLRRYDPNKVAERGDAIRRLVLSCMFERITLEILMSIKPEELRKLDVKEKIDVTQKCIKAIQGLNAKQVGIKKHEEDLLKELTEGTDEGD